MNDFIEIGKKVATTVVVVTLIKATLIGLNVMGKEMFKS